MIKLLKNTNIFSPNYIGKKDVLIMCDKISKISDDLSSYTQLPDIQVYDFHGLNLAPGFIDSHVHIAGGGGEQGFSSRTPDIKLTDLTLAGVTTVLGLLGTDGDTRSVENLYAKAKALEEEGITTFILTGSYAYPSVTLTGDVKRDIMFIDKVIGAKIAISDHRSSHVTENELTRLISESRLGGMLANKAGLTVFHLGDDKQGLSILNEIVSKNPIKYSSLLPTHIGRNENLFNQALKFMKNGGFVDFTVDLLDEDITARQIATALKAGDFSDNISISTDSCGSIPDFDEMGNCIGLTYVLPNIISNELNLLHQKHGIPIEDVIKFITLNPAKRLKIDHYKGKIAEGYDADIVLFDDDFNIHHVFAKGQCMVLDKEVIKRNVF